MEYDFFDKNEEEKGVQRVPTPPSYGGKTTETKKKKGCVGEGRFGSFACACVFWLRRAYHLGVLRPRDTHPLKIKRKGAG